MHIEESDFATFATMLAILHVTLTFAAVYFIKHYKVIRREEDECAAMPDLIPVTEAEVSTAEKAQKWHEVWRQKGELDLMRQQQQFYMDRARRLERARNPGPDDDVVGAPASPSEHEDRKLRCRFLYSGKPTPGTNREMADQYEEAVVYEFRTFKNSGLLGNVEMLYKGAPVKPDDCPAEEELAMNS